MNRTKSVPSGWLRARACVVAFALAIGGCTDAKEEQGRGFAESSDSVPRADDRRSGAAEVGAGSTRERALQIAARQSEGRNEARFHVVSRSGALEASHFARGTRAAFTRGGMRIDHDAGWHLDLRTVSIRCAATSLRLSEGVPRVDRGAPNRVTAARDADGTRVEEWFVNGPLGVEQGWTIERNPCAGEDRLVIELEVDGMAAKGDGTVELVDPEERGAVRYGDAYATDASGRELSVNLRAESAERIALRVETEGAGWPIRVDPLVVVEEGKLSAQGISEPFGPVAVAADWAAVATTTSAPYVQVFSRSGSYWAPAQKLTPNDAGAGFGVTIAMTGDTIVVGATQAVYVFARTGSTWAFQQRISSPNSNSPAVAVGGDTLVVGALSANGVRGGVDVYVRAGVAWTLQQQLAISDGEVGDGFGSSVSISGSTIAIGAPFDDVGANVNHGTAYLFIRSGTTWTEQTRLNNSAALLSFGFGANVSISGDTVVVRSTSYSHGYVRSGSVWTEQHQFNGSGAASVALDGDRLVIGIPTIANNAGGVLLFVRSGTTWSGGVSSVGGSEFPSGRGGTTVAISGDRVFSGAPSRGAAMAYRVSGTTLVDTQIFGDNEARAGAEFGISTSVDGNTAVVASPGARAAYVFVRSGASWTLQQVLNPVGVTGVDSVSVSRDTILAGSRAGAGSVSVFVRSGTTWTFQQRLTPTVGVNVGGFGFAVAVQGGVAVIGSPYDHLSASITNVGAAYVFVRSGTTWTEQQKLTPPGRSEDDQFGAAVALDGNTIVVGEPRNDTGGTDAGSAYVFVRSGTSWSQQGELVASNNSSFDVLGGAVAVSGDVAILGANNANFAVIFQRSASVWSEVLPRLVPTVGSDPGFGFSVAATANGSTLVVGAPGGQTGGRQAYVYVRDGSGWTAQTPVLVASDSIQNDAFGASVSIDGATVVVGATSANSSVTDSGAAYAYKLTGAVPGSTCSGAPQCTPFTCAGGVCCTTSCSGACQACSTAQGGSEEGVCTVRAFRSLPASACTGGFLCDGVSPACPTQCTNDDLCPAGSFCNALNACELSKGTGVQCNPSQQCAEPSDCALCSSGNCVDAHCCNTPCDGPCDQCANGTCGPRNLRTNGDPACDNHTLCNGSSASCPTGCAVDQDCQIGHFCSSGSCMPRQGTGNPCTNSGQCGAGLFCVDDVCCGAECAEPCGACSIAAGGSINGTCTPIPSGRTCGGVFACSGTSVSCPTSCTRDSDCTGGRYCDNFGQCRLPKDLGTSCDPDAECFESGECRLCSSGHCIEGVCCNSACGAVCDTCLEAEGASGDGTCGPRSDGSLGAPACANHAYCNGTLATCPATCASNADCVSGYFCSGNQTCQPTLGAGTACTSDAQCGVGLYCTDGVCCSTPCTEPCGACSVATGGSVDGTCTPLANRTCAAGFVCDGTTIACPNGCKADSECAGGLYCNNEARCVTKKGIGAACDPPGECFNGGACNVCQSGNCVDGVCCNSACDGPCDTCLRGGPPFDGTCAPRAAGLPGAPVCPDSLQCDGIYAACPTVCDSDLYCAPGHYCDAAGDCLPLQPRGGACTSDGQCRVGLSCTDGVCCNTQCRGVCESCGEPGSVGFCVTVEDAPRGNRPACTGSGPCGGRCDGTRADACTMPGDSVECALGSCQNSSETAPSRCDGVGGCTPGATRSCADFACDPTTSRCRETCDTTDHCRAGAVCDTSQSPGVCNAEGTTCSGTHSIRRPDGSNTPCPDGYACTADACVDTCSSALPCAGGFECADTRCRPIGSGTGGAPAGGGAGGAPFVDAGSGGAPADGGAGGTASADAGSGGAAASTGGATPEAGSDAPDAGSSPDAASSDDGGCGCRVQSKGSDRAPWMVALGVLALIRRKRRSRLVTVSGSTTLHR